MELDDFKSHWRHSAKDDDKSLTDTQEILQIISRSKRGIQRAFLADILIATAVWLIFTLVVVFFRHIVMLFLYKMVFITVLFAIPVYYRLYKSIRFLHTIDFGKDIRTNLMEFLSYYKITLQFYLWGTYFMLFVMLGLFFTDDSFLQLPLWIKGVVVLYLALAFLFAGPLVRWMYGKKMESIERFMKE